jgi:hypothetical protein
VSECDREASIMRRPWPTTGSRAMGKKKAIRATHLDDVMLSREKSYAE